MDKKVCWISDAHQDLMLADAKAHYPLETGGVLVGYIANNGEYVVTEIILGGPGAKRAPRTFEADTKWQREQCDIIWNRTHGTEHYIGDWHTHPDNDISLSPMDISCLKVISDEPTCLDHPLMIVLGELNFSKIGVYCYTVDGWMVDNMKLKLYHDYSQTKEEVRA